MSHFSVGGEEGRQAVERQAQSHLPTEGSGLSSAAGMATPAGFAHDDRRARPMDVPDHARPDTGELVANATDKGRPDGTRSSPAQGRPVERMLEELLRTEARLAGERRFPTCTRRAKEVLDELLERLTHLAWDEDERFAVHLAVEEALMNAIKHGNGLDASKHVHVALELTEVWLRIQITDEGSGFDPRKVPDPTLDENLDVPSGRGLMLMRSFMSRVEYNDRGNQVTMEKHRTNGVSRERPE